MESSTESPENKHALRFKGVLFGSLTDTRVARTFDAEWTEAGFQSVFPDLVREAKKAAPFWAAATYAEGTTRGNEGLLRLHAAVLDMDGAELGTLDRVCETLTASGRAHAVYTSWSHRSPDKQGRECFRVLLPYSRPVTPAEHETIVPALYGCELPASPRWDPCAVKPAQGWFGPACPAEREHDAVLEVETGQTLDVEAVLARASAVAPARRVHPVPPATQRAEGALGRLQDALLSAGCGWAQADRAGWHRATCPVCRNSNPSLRAQATGDGLRLMCHSTLRHAKGCTGAEVLDTLGLPPDLMHGRKDHLALLHAQLRAAVPEREWSADEAAEESAHRPPNEIQALPPGTGKTREKLRLAVLSNAPVRVVAPSHRLLDEHRETLIALGAKPEDIAHRKSPLQVVDGMSTCLRVDEPGFTEHVLKARINMRGSVCRSCSVRSRCNAWKQEDAEGRIVLETHAGFSMGTARPFEVVNIDEEPEPLALVKLSGERLADLAASVDDRTQGGNGLRFWSLLRRTQREVLQPFARALHERQVINEETREQVRRFGRRVLAAKGATTPDKWAQWPWFADAVHALMLLADAADIERDEAGNLRAVVASEAYKAILSGAATLLSATPTPGAYDRLGVFRPPVADGCAGITREMHFTSASTKKDLLAAEGGPQRARLDPILATIRERCAELRVLIVTWKWLAAWLKEHPELLPAGCWVEHYGNVAGSNLYQRGGAREVDAVVSVGDYRAGKRWVFEHLARERGLSGPSAEAQIEAWWAEAAANESMQAHGRARDTRRTKPILHLHFGKIAPTSWHSNNTHVVSAQQTAGEKLAAREVLTSVLAAGWTQTRVAEQCGVGAPLVSQWVAGTKPIAPEHLTMLERLRAEAGATQRVVRVGEAQTPVKQALTPPLPDFHKRSLVWGSGNSLDTPLSAAVRVLGSRSKVAQLVGSSTSAVTQVLGGKRKMPAGWAAKLTGFAPAAAAEQLREAA